jgi:hypothetical protein
MICTSKWRKVNSNSKAVYCEFNVILMILQ